MSKAFKLFNGYTLFLSTRGQINGYAVGDRIKSPFFGEGTIVGFNLTGGKREIYGSFDRFNDRVLRIREEWNLPKINWAKKKREMETPFFIWNKIDFLCIFVKISGIC